MLTVLAGDWKENSTAKLVKSWGKVRALRLPLGWFRSETVAVSEIVAIDRVTEENKTSILGKLGWTIAGGVLLGGFGALLGFWKGGQRHKMVVAILFKDGRKVILTGKNKFALKVLAIPTPKDFYVAGVLPPPPAQPQLEAPTIQQAATCSTQIDVAGTAVGA
jgi:hypothetical protein